MLFENAIALFDRMSGTPPASAPVAERQSGAIPYTVVDKTPVFLLITSRQRGHWIFPKGRLATEMTPWASAEREAREEAGVEGTIEIAPIGSYRTWKTRGVRRFVIEVDMYPLRVERQLADWRETDERYRHWAALPEAVRLISDKPMVDLLRRVARRARTESRNYPPIVADMSA